MESPVNSSKSKKNSSKKKKKKETQKSQEAAKETVPAASPDTNAPLVETIAAKTSDSNTSERLTPNQSEECRMLEWLYQNRMRDSGQCVVWGSPQGSPTLRSGRKGNISDSWSPTSESHSVQRRPPRRLINASAGDLPDFLSELTALSERVRAHEEELSKKSSTRENSPAEESGKPDAEEDNIAILEDDGLTDTQTIKDNCELSSLPKLELVNQIANESFSALFDDDDDFMNECMLKCSQEVEEKLQSEFGCGDVNKLSRLTSPQQAAALSPRRRLPEKNNFIARRTSPRNISQTFQNMKGIIKQSCETPKKKVPKVESKFCVQAIRRSPMYCVNGRLLGSPRNQKSLQKNVVGEIVSISTSASNSEIADDSFEAVLQSFMDEDVELLSQGFSEEMANKAVTSVVQQPQQSNPKRPSPARVKKLPNHNTMPIHRINSEDLKTTSNISLQLNGACVSRSYPSLGQIESRQVYNLTKISESKTVISVDSGILNEGGKSCLQEDSSETGSISSSPPLQCTPEEIAKKKREAKLKLEKKKMIVSMAVNKPIINQWNRQTLKPVITKRMK